MATQTAQQSLRKLQAENDKLKLENGRLRSALADAPSSSDSPKTKRRFRWGSFGSIVLLILASALLVAGNILFWAGNTLVKSDHFSKSVTPIIQNSEVQKALAAYTTTQLFANVNVEQYITDALPPRAEFVAPTIAGQLRSGTQATLNKVVTRPQFQERFNTIVTTAHDKYITTVKTHGSDGTIDLNELYQQLSGSLQGTKLSFLANRKLPASVGEIKVANNNRVAVINNIANHIDLWRGLTILLFLLCAVGGVLLARRKRRAVIRLGIFTTIFMFITLIAIRVTREMLAGQVNSVYAEAVRQAYQIFVHPLVVQTATLLLLFVIVAIVAWVSSAARSAALVRSRTSDLLSGKAHGALFGDRENGFTYWIGRHKRAIQWTLVAAIAVVDLLIRLTPTVLITSLIVMVVLVLIVELLAAPQREVEPAKLANALPNGVKS